MVSARIEKALAQYQKEREHLRAKYDD